MNRLEIICAQFRAKLRALLLQAGLARLVVLALGLMLPAVALDWWFHLGTLWRLLVLIAYIFAIGAALFWTLLMPLTRKWSDVEILRFLDHAASSRGERGMLLDFFELQRAAGIQELASATGKTLAESALVSLEPLAQQMQIGSAFQRKNVVRPIALAAILVLALVLVTLFMRQYIFIGCERFFNPFSTRHWPSRTLIAVAEPAGGFQIPQMEAFTLHATVSGAIPPEIQIAYKSASTGYFIKEKIPVCNGGQVSYTLPEVREPLRLYLSGGDFMTDPIELAIVERPYLKSITAHYKYPDYAGLPDKSSAGGQLAGLEGTQVRLVFETSMPVSRAVFALDKSAPEEMGTPASSRQSFEHALMLREDGAYSVELYDAHGFRESRPERYEIRVTPDNPPEVELLAPGRDLVATRNFSVEVAFKARDDFGLKRVELFYQLNDGAPLPISDRVTGPITQSGRVSESRFTWDLRKMEELPDTATINYFVRVQDINPTGRGKAETAHRQIKLVKPSDFHLETLENGKGLLTEALIAWRNQLDAWKLGAQWQKSGTGKEDDAAWREMIEKQENAIRAARAMSSQLAIIAEAYENNHMQREFMAARLNEIAELLKRLNEKEHLEISTRLREARPQTDADSAPERLKSLRSTALSRCAADQKIAVLILERLLRKTYDWRDLQTTTITSSLLHERQDEIGTTTEKVSPNYIGKEFEDLSDPEQEQLLTLGKQQRAIFDTETQLETQLAMQIFKAEKQRRKSIHIPLKAAFEGLRANRVNDNLKEAAAKIENNQPSVIIKNQRAALRALEAVKTGLVFAGQKLDPDEPLNGNMEISEAAKFEEVEAAKEEKKDEKPSESAQAGAMSVQQLESVLPEGGDALSMALRLAIEKQDDVLARTRYLAEKNPAQEMPRFMHLKFGMLSERQAIAIKALERATQEAEKTSRAPLKQMLALVREEFAQSAALLAEKNVSPCTQQIQDDAISMLRDLLQFIAFEKAVGESAIEIRRRNGVDAFQRKFLLRGKNLDTIIMILADANHARLLQHDVARKLARFVKKPMQNEIETTNRKRAANAQKKVAALFDAIRANASELSKDVASRVRESSLDAMLAIILPSDAELAAGGKDKELLAIADDAAKMLGTCLQNLRDLLEERVQPKPEAVALKKLEEPKKISAEEYEKMNSREALIAGLKSDAALSPEIRETMINALSKVFPAKFKALLTAYYASFGAEQSEKEKKP
ncbi:MAG TPA: hypothetical protein VKX17_20445 [Planctomycetota bacterium]|nr:hypothetical protein [Planctomycetota bacterium]